MPRSWHRLAQEALEHAVGSLQRRLWTALALLMRLRLFAGPEVRRRNAQLGQLRDVGPGLLGLDRRRGHDAELLQERVVENDRAARGPVGDGGGGPELARELLHLALRLREAPSRRESEVEVQVAAGGDHVAPGEPLDARHRHDLTVQQLADPRLAR